MWKISLSVVPVFLMMTALGMTQARAEDAAQPGQKIFIQLKCNQCHTIDSLKIAKTKGDADEEEEVDENGKKIEVPDLSGVGNTYKADFLKKWLMKEEKIEGKKHKKKFKGTPEELQTVADWMATLKFNVPKKKKG